MSDETPKPVEPEPLKEVKPDEIRQLGKALFLDLNEITTKGKKAASDVSSKTLEKLWKTVNALSDKNLACIYRSHDATKLASNTAFDYVKHAIINRFIERALENAPAMPLPYITQI